MLKLYKKPKKEKKVKPLKQHRKIKGEEHKTKNIFCFCMQCKKKVQMNGMILVKLRNERQVWFRRCPKCDSPIYKRRKD